MSKQQIMLFKSVRILQIGFEGDSEGNFLGRVRCATTGFAQYNLLHAHSQLIRSLIPRFRVSDFPDLSLRSASLGSNKLVAAQLPR